MGHEGEPLIVQELPKDCVLLDDRRDPGRGGIMYDSKNITERLVLSRTRKSPKRPDALNGVQP